MIYWKHWKEDSEHLGLPGNSVGRVTGPTHPSKTTKSDQDKTSPNPKPPSRSTAQLGTGSHSPTSQYIYIIHIFNIKP